MKTQKPYDPLRSGRFNPMFNEKLIKTISFILFMTGIVSGAAVLVSRLDPGRTQEQTSTESLNLPRDVFVFSEERIPVINRETGRTEQKILLQYAIDGVSSYAELDDEDELARYYKYLRQISKGR